MRMYTHINSNIKCAKIHAHTHTDTHRQTDTHTHSKNKTHCVPAHPQGCDIRYKVA
jgi:hypothetical protein